MGALAVIFSLSCVVQVFGTETETTSDAQLDASTKNAAHDNSALRHKIINDYNVDHASDHVLTDDMVARVKARSAEMTEKREARKLQQTEFIKSKKLQQALEEDAATEPKIKKSLESVAEAKVIIHQKKEERYQRNKALSKDERIQKAQALLARATAMQNVLDKKAEQQGTVESKQERIKKAQALLAVATAAQKELDERAQACGIDKNERIKKARAILAEATRIQNELYS